MHFSVRFDSDFPICYTVAREPPLKRRFPKEANIMGARSTMQTKTQGTGTYDTILASALYIFSRKGYVESKMEEIAKDAGVNAATVYRYFSDKRTLFQTVVEVYGPLEDESIFQLDSRLSYTDVPRDMELLAVEYFKIIYANIDILQIFMGESCYISKIKDQAWHIPPALVTHFSDYLHRVNPKNRSTKKSRRLLAEMFLSDIIRFAVEHTNKAAHTHFSEALLRDFEAHIRGQLPCLFVLLRRTKFIK